MPVTTTIEVGVVHDAQKVGLDGHTCKHAHVATTSVAFGDTADSGADGAKNDANGLPSCCDGLMTTNRNLEHEPMRQHVPSYVRLAEDMGAFEMKEGVVELALRRQLSSQPDFLFE